MPSPATSTNGLDAVEAYTTLPVDTDPLDKQRKRYAALKAARDRALVFVLAYTAVRVGELLRDPNDPRRARRPMGGDLSTTGVWTFTGRNSRDAASLPDPVISPLRSYRRLMDPLTGGGQCFRRSTTGLCRGWCGTNWPIEGTPGGNQ